jgi:hypothetical protein
MQLSKEHSWTRMTRKSQSTWRRICLSDILSTINPPRKGLLETNPGCRQLLIA